MKRITAILLLIILSFTSVHTTWAFHYCGGHLHSIGIAGGQTAAGCCGTDEQTNHASEDKAGKFAVIAQPETPCCLNHLIKISTDDFQVSQQQILSNIGTNPVYIPADQIFLSENPEIFRKIQYTFPPGNPVTYKVDLLTLICTFII